MKISYSEAPRKRVVASVALSFISNGFMA
jgi:hypothetical protein